MAAGGDDDAELAAALAMSMGEEPAAADGGLAAAAAQLAEQPAAARATAAKTLAKLVENLVGAPQNPKFRRVRVGNAKIQAAVLGVPGGEAFLRSLGFADSAATAEHAAGTFLEIGEAEAAAVAAGRGAAALAALAGVAAAGQLVLSRLLAAQGCEVRGVAALPDGALATAGTDNLVRLFPADGLGADAPPRVLSGHVAKNGVPGVNAVLATADGRLLSGGKDGSIIAWDTAAAAPAGDALVGHGDSSGATLTNQQVVSCLADVGAGRVASGGWDTTARLWQPGGGQQALKAHTAAVLAVAATEVGGTTVIVSGGGDGKLCVWAAEGGALLQTVEAHGSPIRGVGICDDVLATGDNTGRLRRWRLSLPAGGSLALTPDGDLPSAHSSYIFAVVGVGDGLWSGGDDCRIRRWACEGALAPAQEIACPSPVLALAPLPEAAGLVAGLEDGSACVWCADASRAASSAQTAEFQAAAAARTVALDAEAAGRPPAAAAAPPAGGAASGGYAINFPVELPGSDRPMQVSWNPGEDPAAVAERFLAENGLPQNHHADVVQFVQSATQQMGATSSQQTGFDFEFPVELSMGGSLKIQWNRGESPDEIADRFLARHSLSPDNKPDILAFITQAQAQQGGQAPAAPAAPDAQTQEALVMQVRSVCLWRIGFPSDGLCGPAGRLRVRRGCGARSSGGERVVCRSRG